MVTVVWWLLSNALAVAALAPAVWVLSRAFRRRPAVEHLLWFLLLVKLVAPPMIDWPWSLERVMKAVNEQPETLAEVALDPARRSEDVATPDSVPETALFEMQAASREMTLPSVVQEHVATRYPMYEIAVLMWAAGTAVLLILGLFAVWRQRNLLRTSTRASDSLVILVGRLARQLGVRPPRVAVSSRISTPIVSCLGRPSLVWPAEMSEPEVVTQCEAVVAHELSHLVRGDHFFLYAESLVALCCWWNPLLWVIRRRLRETRELACDALALAAVEASRSDYARRLLDLSICRTDSLVVAPAFGAGNLSRRFLKRRITMVFDERTSGRISARGAMLAAVLTLVGLPGWTLADPPAETQSAEKSESISTTTTSQSSTSSATSGDAADLAGPVTADGVFNRSYRLSRVLKDREISNDKPAEIPLGNGGIIRITKNQNGDLVVTVEQTESGKQSRAIRHGRTTGQIAVDASTGTATNSNGGIVGSASADAAPGTPGVLTGGGSVGTSSGAIRVVPRQSSSAGVQTRPSFDREMLQSDVALAEVGVMEKRAELDIASKSNVDEAHLKLAELGLKRAEIELQRAKLRLKRSETGYAQ